jgi:adenosine/AMP kinase
VVVMKEMYPINVLTRIKEVPEVVAIYCATANPVQVMVGVTAQGRGILGVVDGESPLRVETEAEVAARKELVRKLGYKQ